MKYGLPILFFLFFNDELTANQMLCISPVIAVESQSVVASTSSPTSISNEKAVFKKRSFKARLPWHLLAKTGFILALVSIIGIVGMPLIAFATGYLSFEFGYLTAIVAITGVALAVRALTDIQKEPGRWRGKRASKIAVWVGSGVLAMVAAWFLVLAYKY